MEELFEKVNECFKGKTIVFTLVYNKKKFIFYPEYLNINKGYLLSILEMYEMY